MSDDFDFDFNEPSPEPVANSTPQPEETPALPSGPSVEEITTLQKRLENAERWQQDFARLAGQMGGQPQQAPQPDRLTKFIQDPDGYENELLGKAAQVARSQLQEMQAIEKVRAEFPELTAFENVIDWGSLMQVTTPQFMQKHGRQPSFEEALRESATYMKSTLPGLGTNSQSGQREVLRLNAGGAAPPQPQGLEGLNLDDLSKEDFYKLQAKLQAKHY